MESCEFALNPICSRLRLSLVIEQLAIKFHTETLFYKSPKRRNLSCLDVIHFAFNMDSVENMGCKIQNKRKPTWQKIKRN